MAEEVKRPKPGPVEEPVYEIIDAGRINRPAAEDGDTPPAGPGTARILLGRAGQEALGAIRSGRFWWQAAAVFLGSLGVGLLLANVVVTGGDFPPEALGWAFLLTAATIIVASCVLAVKWTSRPPEGATLPREPRVSPDATGHPDPEESLDGGFHVDATADPAEGPFWPWAGAGGRGLVFAALSAVFLLIVSFATESSPAVAVVAGVIVFLEFLVFGGIGAGASFCFRPHTGRVIAWSAATLLLVGNLMAVVALFPTVRAYERTVVAVNIERDDLGRVVSYQCLPEFRGIAEVYHTERIVWLAAGNPIVIFALLTGEADPREDALAWLPGELQNAAEGSQVPCVEGQETAETGAELPLAAAGIAMQLGVAGACLAGGQVAAVRKVSSAG